MKTKLLKINCLLILSCVLGAFQITTAQNGLDASFGQAGTITTTFNSKDSYAESVIQLANNKIVVAGGAGDNLADIALASYLQDGSADTSFGTNGTLLIELTNLSSTASSIVEDANGNILIAGFVEDAAFNYQAVLIRISPSGVLDGAFGTNGVVLTNFGTTMGAGALAIAMQSDGKIILGGATIDYDDPVYDELGDFALARYNADGSVDTTFGNGGYVVTAFDDNYFDLINSIKIQADGKIVAAGYSGTEDPATFEDSSNAVVARYNTNGSLDNSFGTNGKKQINVGLMDYIEGLAIQADGKILLSGDTTNENFDYVTLLIRLNINGSLDSSFSGDGIVTTQFLNGSDFYFSSAVSVIPNGDGTIIAAGTSQNETSNIEYVTFAKYTANGALDTTFRGDGKFISMIDGVYVNQAIVTSSGKLLVAGEKNSSVNGNFEYNIFLAQFLLTNTLGIDDADANFISVYPNPVSSQLNIKFAIGVPNTEISLYDVLGKEVKAIKTDKINEQISMENLSPGVYYLNVVQEGKITTKKIVKN